MRSSAPVKPSCRSDSSCFTAYLMKAVGDAKPRVRQTVSTSFNTRSENLIDRCGNTDPLNTKGLWDGMSGRCWAKILKKGGASQTGCSGREMQPVATRSNESAETSKPIASHPTPFMFGLRLRSTRNSNSGAVQRPTRVRTRSSSPQAAAPRSTRTHLLFRQGSRPRCRDRRRDAPDAPSHLLDAQGADHKRKRTCRPTFGTGTPRPRWSTTSDPHPRASASPSNPWISS